MFYNKLDIVFLLSLTALLTAAWDSEDYHTVNVSLIGSRIVAVPLVLMREYASAQTLVIHQWVGPSVVAQLAPDSTPDRAE